MSGLKQVCESFPRNGREWRLRILLCVWGLLVTLSTARAEHSPRLEQRLREAQRHRHYEAPSLKELAQFEELLERTIRAQSVDEAIQREWSDFGWQWIEWETGSNTTWVLLEQPGLARGWGFYVVRPRQLPGIVLQAPHSFSDKYTRTVALRLFQDGEFAAAAWNTVLRDQVDVAHVLEHPYSVFTRVLARLHPNCSFAQIHGFNQEERRTENGKSADLIISGGTDFPEQWVRKTAVLMQTGFPYGQVRLFPLEVQELGATTNVQGELLRQLGSTRFIHFEMSQALRLRLVADAHARQLFLKNLSEGVD